MFSKKQLADVAIYGVVIASSVGISIANLAGSLKILDIASSATILSLMVAIYNISYTIMSWLWTSIFFGRISRRGIIAISMFGISIGLIAMALGETLLVVAIGSALVGLFGAIVAPLLTTLLTDYLGHDAVAVTRYNIFSSFGLILGYLVGGFLRPYMSTSFILCLTGVIVMAFTSLVRLIPYKYAAIEPRRVTYVSLIPQFTGRLRPLPSILFSPEIVYNFRKLFNDFNIMLRRKLARKLPLTLLATGTLFVGISLFFTPIPAFLRSLGLTDTELYLTYMYSTAVSAFSYLLVHRHVKKAVEAWKPLILSTGTRALVFLFPISLLFIQESRTYALFIVELTFTAIGITWAYISTSLPTIMLSLSETERRDERLGHLNASIGAGTITGSILAGVIYQAFKYEGVFVGSSFIVLIATTLYIKAQKTLVT